MRTKRRQEEQRKNEKRGIRKYEVHRSLLISFPPPPPRAACSRIPFIPHSLFLFFPLSLIMRLPVFARSSQENGKAPFLSHILFTRIKAPHEPNTETSIKTTKRRKKKLFSLPFFFLIPSSHSLGAIPHPPIERVFLLRSSSLVLFLAATAASEPASDLPREPYEVNERNYRHTHTHRQTPNYTKAHKTKKPKQRGRKRKGSSAFIGCAFRIRVRR